MRHLTQGLCLAGALTLTGILASCVSENPWGNDSGAKGRIHLSIETDGDVASAKPIFRSGEDGVQVSDYLTIPDAGDFKIKIEKKDGSYSSMFGSIDALNESNEGFTAGAYSLTAYYGEKGTQGFDCPYFEGTTDFTVLSDRTTDIDVTAAMKNSMVVLEYTEQFKDYMQSWDATIYTEGVTGGINYASDETRAAFIEPVKAHIGLSITTTEGKSTTVIVGGEFAPLAKTLYHVTIDVKAKETGTAAISVTFDDSLDEEPVEIDLTEELFTTPRPTIETIGFTNGERVDLIEGTASEMALKMNVVAKAGIAHAYLTINSDNFTPAWGKEIDLCAATPAQQTQLSDAGFNAIGFFKNPDKLAFLDFTAFGEKLPKGEHTVQLRVIDVNNGTSEATSVILDTQVFTIDAVSQNILFGSNEATMIFDYNGFKPEKDFSFKAINEAGNMENVEIKKCELVNGTRALEVRRYVFTLQLQESTRTVIKIEAYHKGCLVDTFQVPVTTPEYTIAADPYTNSAVLKISSDDSSTEAAIARKLRVHIKDGNEITDITRNPEAGIMKVGGLTPETQYVIETSLNGKDWINATNFTTDAAAEVPNGDFETLVETINKTINQGGTWTITSGGTKYQTTLSMLIQEPAGWTSSNPTTCNLNASNVNSWYVIPSVYNTTLTWVSNQPNAKVFGIGQSAYKSTADVYKNLSAASGSNAMVIRNVAWDAAGANIASKSQTGNTSYSNYYCSNVPELITNRSAGYMYLGTSSKEGVDFTARPVKLRGKYKYVQDSQDTGEKGIVTIKLLDGDTVLGSGSLELGAADSYSDFTVPIEYNSNLTFGRKPTTLKIWIASSNKTSDIKTTNYCNKDECCSRGAALYIDNLTFAY